jgi:hypothetical protein
MVTTVQLDPIGRQLVHLEHSALMIMDKMSQIVLHAHLVSIVPHMDQKQVLVMVNVLMATIVQEGRAQQLQVSILARLGTIVK